MGDKDLTKKIQEYTELAKNDPNVDINALMLSAFDSEHRAVSEAKSYKWAYLISVGAPPFGAIYAVKYFLSGDARDKTAAYVCLILTAISIIFFALTLKTFTASSGVSLDQIQQINSSDVQELVQ